MIQHGGDARLAQKHVHHRLMFRPTRLQDLEHQFLVERAHCLVRGKEDLRHPTCGQMLDQGVGTEPGAFEFFRACHAICRMRTNYHTSDSYREPVGRLRSAQQAGSRAAWSRRRARQGERVRVDSGGSPQRPQRSQRRIGGREEFRTRIRNPFLPASVISVASVVKSGTDMRPP